jgi:hypothetical protein
VFRRSVVVWSNLDISDGCGAGRSFKGAWVIKRRTRNSKQSNSGSFGMIRYGSIQIWNFKYRFVWQFVQCPILSMRPRWSSRSWIPALTLPSCVAIQY